MPTETEMPHEAPAGESRSEHAPRVWPKQVIAMCQETLNCLSTLRGCQKSGALVATRREIEDMASELDKVSRCAATLATDFKEGT